MTSGGNSRDRRRQRRAQGGLARKLTVTLSADTFAWTEWLNPYVRVHHYKVPPTPRCWRCEREPEQSAVGLCMPCLDDLRQEAR